MFIVKTDVKTALKHKKSEKQLIDLFDRYGLFYIGRPKSLSSTFVKNEDNSKDNSDYRRVL